MNNAMSIDDYIRYQEWLLEELNSMNDNKRVYFPRYGHSNRPERQYWLNWLTTAEQQREEGIETVDYQVIREVVVLFDQMLDDEEMPRHVASFIQTLTKVKEIHIDFRSKTDVQHTSAILMSLQSTLEKVYLGATPSHLTWGDYQSLVDTLCQLPVLTELTIAGFEYETLAPPTNPPTTVPTTCFSSLVKLNFDCNEPDVVTTILRLLRHLNNQSLHELKISHLGRNYLSPVLEFLQNGNTSLCELELDEETDHEMDATARAAIKKHVDYYLKLNRLGRGKLTLVNSNGDQQGQEGGGTSTPSPTREQWLEPIMNSSNDLDVIYYFIRANPTLCEGCRVSEASNKEHNQKLQLEVAQTKQELKQTQQELLRTHIRLEQSEEENARGKEENKRLKAELELAKATIHLLQQSQFGNDNIPLTIPPTDTTTTTTTTTVTAAATAIAAAATAIAAVAASSSGNGSGAIAAGDGSGGTEVAGGEEHIATDEG